MRYLVAGSGGVTYMASQEDFRYSYQISMRQPAQPQKCDGVRDLIPVKSYYGHSLELSSQHRPRKSSHADHSVDTSIT